MKKIKKIQDLYSWNLVVLNCKKFICFVRVQMALRIVFHRFFWLALEEFDHYCLLFLLRKRRN